MAPKKGKKMDLNAFLADESTGGSWADEMDSLPTGPSGDPTLNAGGLGGSHLSRGMGRESGYGRGGDDYNSDRPQRAEVPFPTAPPYTAFVGNLTFETMDQDLRDFFGPSSDITSIRLVSGQDGKPKGFGYIEFKSSEHLRSALSQSGHELNGRTVRISVAEAPKDGRVEGRADSESTWTRSGPLAPLASQGGRSGGFGSQIRSGGFGSTPREENEIEREGPIRGGKFQPSASTGSFGTTGEPRRSSGFGGTGERNVSGSVGGYERREFQSAPMMNEVEREGPIRGGKFQPSTTTTTSSNSERSTSGSFGTGGPVGDRRVSGGFRNDGSTMPMREPSRADEEKVWTRGAALPPAPQRSGSGGFGRGSPGAFGDRTPPTEGSSERPRLQLSARSSTEASPSASPIPSSRPSPFGSAKPIDAREREKEIEAKMAKEKQVLAAKVAASSVAKAAGLSGQSGSDKEKEVEDKIAKARLAVVGGANKNETSSSTSLSETLSVESSSTTPALRKEGFSYSSAANKTLDSNDKTTVEQVADKVAETKIE